MRGRKVEEETKSNRNKEGTSLNANKKWTRKLRKALKRTPTVSRKGRRGKQKGVETASLDERTKTIDKQHEKKRKMRN